MDVMFISKLRKPIGMQDQEFFGAWLAEGEAAVGALDAGRMKVMYKVAGEYKLVGILTVDELESVDRIIHELPIFKGGHMDIVESYEWFFLCDYRDWVSQLKELASRP